MPVQPDWFNGSQAVLYKQQRLTAAADDAQPSTRQHKNLTLAG